MSLPDQLKVTSLTILEPKVLVNEAQRIWPGTAVSVVAISGIAMPREESALFASQAEVVCITTDEAVIGVEVMVYAQGLLSRVVDGGRDSEYAIRSATGCRCGDGRLGIEIQNL